MSKSRARLLAELLNSTGLVKKSKSALAGADEVIDLDSLPTITNAKLENSSITINSTATSLGESITLTTADVAENTNLYYTDARADARVALVIDSAPSTLNTLNELAAALGDDENFSTTVTNSIATKLPLAGGTLTGNVTFGDNNKAVFGAGSDLQIYHNGTYSVIKEAGDGDLEIQTNGSEIQLTGNAGTDYMLRAISNGSVKLYYNNSPKLATTSTGIDVTGDVVASRLKTEGTEPTLFFNDTTTGHDDWKMYADWDQFQIQQYVNDTTWTSRLHFAANGNATFSGSVTADGLTVNSGGTSSNMTIRNSGTSFLSVYSDTNGVTVLDVDANNTGSAPRFQIDVGDTQVFRITEGGDISFYEDTGSDAKFFWDASTESLGIGGASTFTSGTNIEVKDSNVARLGFTNTSTNGSQFAWYSGTAGQAALYDYDNSAQRITIDSSGNVGIGTSIPSSVLHAKGGSTTTSASASDFLANATARLVVNHANEYGAYVGYANSVTDAIAIQSARTDGTTGPLALNLYGGNVGIGTSSPSTPLTVATSTSGWTAYLDNNATSGAKSGLLMDAGSTSADFAMYVRNAAADSDLFAIKGNGNVGIGTSSPSHLLHVNGGNQFNTGWIRANTGTAANPNFTIDGGAGMFKPTSNEVAFSTASIERMRIRSSETVVNEGSNDYDFRVESDSNTHMLFVDGGNNHVNIGTSVDFGGVLNVNGGLNSKQAVFTSTNNRGLALSTATRSGQNDGVAIIDAQDTEATGGRLELHTMGAERARFERDQIVFNQQSRDQDFRVESNNHTHKLFVSASNDRIGINKSAPDKDVHIKLKNNLEESALLVESSGSATYGGYIRSAFDTQMARFGALSQADGGLDGASVAFEDFGRDIAFRVHEGSNNTEVMRLAKSGLLTHNGPAVFNETSLDADFRVESNSNTHALFVDAGNNAVAINASNPSANEFRVASAANFVTSTGTTPFNITRTGGTDQALQIYVDDTNVYFDSVQDEADLAYGGYYFRSSNGTNDNKNLLIMNQMGTTFNENSLDADFRVESNSNTHMLFVDAGANTVGINASLPRTTLHVNVDGATGGTSNDWNNDKWFLIADGSGASDSGFGITHTAASGTWINSLDPYTSWRDIIVNGDNFKYFQGGSREIMALGYHEAVFNDGSTDADFRVESDSNTHMLLVDAGHNAVGIGASPVTSSELTVSSGSDTNLVLDGQNYSTWVQDSQWNTLLLGGAYWSGGPKYGVSNRGASQIYMGHDGNATPSVQGFVFSAAPAGTAGASPSFESLASITRAGTVFNDDGNDRDFRVESDSNANAFVLDAAQSHIGINKSTQSNVTFSINSSATNASTYGFEVCNSSGNSRFISRSDGYAAFYDANNVNIIDIGSAATGATRFNAAGIDRDFVIESDSYSHALFVDAGSNNILFGRSTHSWTANNVMIASPVNGGIAVTANGDWGLQMAGQTSERIRFFSSAGGSSTVGNISVDTAGTTYTTTSDLRLKKDIETITDGTDKLMAMNPVTHGWKADPEAEAVHGFIAQEMMDIVPEAVSGDPEGEEMMSMDYGRITPVLVAALQDAIKEIQELKIRINELEGK